MNLVSLDDLSLIVAHRLAVARAAQRDAMRWWDDQSLAAGADGLARRLFPRSAIEATGRLALIAGHARHEQAVQEEVGAQHLFFLGEEVEYRLDQAADEISFRPPSGPLRDRGALASALRALGPEPDQVPMTDRGNGRIRLPREVLDLPPLGRARVFAWACAWHDGSGAVFPFATLEQGTSG